MSTWLIITPALNLWKSYFFVPRSQLAHVVGTGNTSQKQLQIVNLNLVKSVLDETMPYCASNGVTKDLVLY